MNKRLEDLIDEVRAERKGHFYNSDSDAGEIAYDNCGTLTEIIELLIEEIEILKNKHYDSMTSNTKI